MSTTLAEESYDETARPRGRFAEVMPWVGMLAGLSVVVGALSAVFWVNVVDLPEYFIERDYSATVSERGLTEFVAADAWYVVCGVLVGVGLGIVAWRWFKPLGWPSALLAAGAGLLAGIVCWKFGELLGPGDFYDRLAKAEPGQLVPISLTLRSMSAPAVWAFAAVTPVLLASSLGPEEAPPRPRRFEPSTTEQVESVDERGVLTEVAAPESPQ